MWVGRNPIIEVKPKIPQNSYKEFRFYFGFKRTDFIKRKRKSKNKIKKSKNRRKSKNRIKKFKHRRR